MLIAAASRPEKKRKSSGGVRRVQVEIEDALFEHEVNGWTEDAEARPPWRRRARLGSRRRRTSVEREEPPRRQRSSSATRGKGC